MEANGQNFEMPCHLQIITKAASIARTFLIPLAKIHQRYSMEALGLDCPITLKNFSLLIFDQMPFHEAFVIKNAQNFRAAAVTMDFFVVVAAVAKIVIVTTSS
jgi:hypothetical protein